MADTTDDMAAIYQKLKADHDQHRAMLVAIDEAKGDKARRDALFEEFRIAVTGHAAAEEQSLYARMMLNPETSEDARHAVAEHKEIDDMITELATLAAGDRKWAEKFTELRSEYDHHIKEEEEEMFPKATEHLSSAEEAEAAQVYDDRKPEEEQKAAETDPAEKEARE